MVTDNTRKRLPPYVSYRTFLNFIDGLQQRMPARIDRSYWGDMLAGSTGTQLMAALRFLALIDAEGKPLERLRPLSTAKGSQRQLIFKEIAYDSYSFVLKGPVEPQSATYAQVQELFSNNFQLTGDVTRKCIKFFVALAGDAEIPLSPFITKRLRGIHSISGSKNISKRIAQRTNRNLVIPQQVDEIPDALLSKFPVFDPNWSEEVKLKWFDAFDKLLTRSQARGQK